jgi:hypothetical protein
MPRVGRAIHRECEPNHTALQPQTLPCLVLLPGNDTVTILVMIHGQGSPGLDLGNHSHAMRDVHTVAGIPVHMTGGHALSRVFLLPVVANEHAPIEPIA